MNFRPLIHPPADWLDQPSAARVARVAVIAAAGLAAYGFTVGFWRSPLMAVFVAVKMPLLVALTLACNGLLNGLLGLLLGTGLGFRQSLLALLSSFALAALILGSLAPVTWLMAWNAPPPDSTAAETSHAGYLLAHTFLIATAGLAANLHLHRQLTARSTSRAAAKATLVAWLSGNAFLGAQFSWVLRPFFGSPGLDVQFLRPDPLRGNFYQTVWFSLRRISGDRPDLVFWAIAFLAVLALGIELDRKRKKLTPTPQP